MALLNASKSSLQVSLSAFVWLQMLSKNESNKKEKVQPKKEAEDSEEEIQDEIEDAVQKVRNATGCLVSVAYLSVWRWRLLATEADWCLFRGWPC